MKVLVTGSAGFIGSNLCHHLVSEGHSVVGIDAYKIGSDKNNTSDLRESEKLAEYTLDLSTITSDVIQDMLEKHEIDNVVHLAAESHVDRSIEGNRAFWETQVLGTQTLFEAIHRHGKVSRIVNQITDEVYGEVSKGTDPPKEGSLFNPNPFYAASKAAQYYVGKSYWKTYGLPVMSTFPVNNYGPRQYAEKLIPKFVTMLIAGKKVPLMKSTHFERDWLPVIDMAKALTLLLEKGQPGEDYNIGADNHCSNLELTHKILALLGKGEDSIEIIEDRLTHDSRYAVDYSKISNLGWKVEEDFDEYLESTVLWYKSEKL